MQLKPVFIVSGSGVSITPEAFDMFLAYIRHYISSNRALVDEYLRELQTAPSDTVVTDMQYEIERAEEFAQQVEELREEAASIYRQNFFQWADVFRKIRIYLKLERIEDMDSMLVAVNHAMEALRDANSKFSRDKFISYINENGGNTSMKETMIKGGITPDGVPLWICPCGAGYYDEGIGACTETGKLQATIRYPEHFLELCMTCRRIFNCHTGEILRQPGEEHPVYLVPNFTDYEYLDFGGRKLPTYKGYTVDMLLGQFRLTEMPHIFIPFDTEEGDALLAELLELLPHDHQLKSELLKWHL